MAEERARTRSTPGAQANGDRVSQPDVRSSEVGSSPPESDEAAQPARRGLRSDEDPEDDGADDLPASQARLDMAATEAGGADVMEILSTCVQMASEPPPEVRPMAAQETEIDNVFDELGFAAMLISGRFGASNGKVPQAHRPAQALCRARHGVWKVWKA